MAAINQDINIDTDKPQLLQPKTFSKASFGDIRQSLQPKQKNIDQVDVAPKTQPGHHQALVNAKANLSRVAAMLEQIHQDAKLPAKSNGTQPQDRINEIIERMETMGPTRDRDEDPSSVTGLKGSPVTVLGKQVIDEKEYSLVDLKSDGPLALDTPLDEPRNLVVDTAISQLNERTGLLGAIASMGRPVPSGVIELIGFLQPHDASPQSLALAWEQARELRTAFLGSPAGIQTSDGTSRIGATQVLSTQ